MTARFRLQQLRLIPVLLMIAVSLVVACTAGSAIAGRTGGKAPEFQGIANWINSDPLTMEELRGKVVLIDFWTYTCVNCIRTLPYLKEWHAKYADKGLVIVGVHSPEFEFEKVTENVVQSMNSFGLEYPVAQDNDFRTWRAYSNRAWPAKYLVDKDGVIRYKHFGEGAYRETERQIRQLLQAAGADLSRIRISDAAEPRPDRASRARNLGDRLTRELYGGYRRNNTRSGIYFAQEEYYDGPDRVVDYVDPGDYKNHHIYLQGPWINGQEELRHARVTEGYEDYIAIRFSATSVNVVIDPGDSGPFEVQVTMDGRPLQAEEAGIDGVLADGRSFLRVDEGRMYQLVALPEYESHDLRLSSQSDNFSMFAFTFGAYEQGP